MRKLKKKLVMIITLFLICSLTACANPGNNANDEKDWVWSLNFAHGALSDQGYYFTNGEGLLSYADLTTGTSVVLCDIAGCNHKSCEANISRVNSMRSMFFWKEHLYYIMSDSYGAHLYSRDATGLALKKVGTLGDKYIKEQMSLEVYNYALAGGYLYYTAQVYDSVFDEKYGVNTTKNVLDCICRINLHTGAEEVLVEERIDSSSEKIQVIAAQKNGMLFIRWEGTKVDTSDPNYRDALYQSAVTLQNWNEQTGEISAVLQKTLREFSKVEMITEENLYYRVSSTVGEENAGYTYVYDLKTGKERMVCKDILWHIGGGYALRSNLETGEQYVYNLQTGELLPNALCELSDSVGILRAMSEKGFVLEWMGELRKEHEDDTSGYRTVYYSYVAYAALADGLQEEDLLTLYTTETLSS